jgi:hypothetical protein
MSLYRTGKVYRIVCLSNPEIQYVGSTFNQLRHRFTQHKIVFRKWTKDKTNAMISIFPYFNQYGIENFRMILIKEYIVCAEHNKDSRHLKSKEQIWINKLKCVNKIASFGIWCVVKKSVSKMYRITNKEIISEKGKIHYSNNKEMISDKHKIHREEHKEMIRDHNKIYREEHKEMIREHNKIYKDKTKAIRSQPITCECSCIIQKRAKFRHMKSKKHIQLMLSLEVI